VFVLVIMEKFWYMLVMFHMFVWWFKILKLRQALVSLALKQRLFGKHLQPRPPFNHGMRSGSYSQQHFW